LDTNLSMIIVLIFCYLSLGLFELYTMTDMLVAK